VPERDERYVDGCQRRPIVEQAGVEVPEIGSIEHYNSRILLELPCELAVTDVDGVYFARAVAEQTVGEPACRCADVDSDCTFDGGLEMADCGFEFCAAPAYIRVEFAAYLYPNIGRHLCTGFVNHAIVHRDATGKNQSPGNFA